VTATDLDSGITGSTLVTLQNLRSRHMVIVSLVSRWSWFGRRASTGRVGRPAPRLPRLEGLEDRTLLSPGDLDPTFGNGGLVTTPPPPTFGLYAQHVAVQGDGRILVADLVRHYKGQPSIELIRYQSDGSLDTSFGSNGMVGVPVPRGSLNLVGMALQSDGRILVSGTLTGFALARYNSDGSLDTSFGAGGTVNTPFPGYFFVAAPGVAVQPDGAIVLAGFASNASSGLFALARYTTRGVLDSSFGNHGLILTAFPDHAAATAVTLQDDGSIIAAGYAYGTSTQFALARYDHDGNLDPSFGTAGLVVTPFPGFSTAFPGNDVTVQSDGRIVLAGYVSNQPSGGDQFALARYNSDGSLDGSFGTGGLVTTSFPDFTRAEAFGMVEQSSGRILVAGGAYPGDGSEQFALARYDSDGSLDGSFGTGGLVTTPFGTLRNASAAAVAVQPDGRIVAAGTASGNNAVARYEGDALAATHFDLSIPAEVTAGQGFGVTVTARDDYGHVATGYAGTVTLTSTDPLAPALGSHTFTTAEGGTFTFTAVRLFTARAQSLSADDGDLNGQANLLVDPGVAVAIVLSGPDHATVGVPVVVTVTAVDAWGNVATGYTGTVWLEATDPDADLPDAWDFTADDAGTHQFTLTLRTPGPVRLTAHDSDAGWLANFDLTVT
jgi:uncharacterized delta-60 repeat protein